MIRIIAATAKRSSRRRDAGPPWAGIGLNPIHSRIDDQGMLKLLFDPDSLKLLGVYVIGDRAAEIVHIGQAVLALGA